MLNKDRHMAKSKPLKIYKNITTADAISLASQKLEDDMVHLTDEADWMFVDRILLEADSFLLL